VRHLRIVSNMTRALNRSGGEAAWPEPPEEFVHQLADEIGERRRPAPDGGRRFRLSFALVAAVALLLPLAAFADQAGDNLARRDDSVEVELVATDDDDDGGGGGGGDDSETSVAGAYDVGGDSESESSGHVGEYDDGGGDDSESDDDGAAQAPAPPAPVDAGGDDSDSGSDDGAAAAQTPLPPLPNTPAPVTPAPGGGDDDSDSGGEDT
jgi:hypothetical protein